MQWEVASSISHVDTVCFLTSRLSEGKKSKPLFGDFWGLKMQSKIQLQL